MHLRLRRLTPLAIATVAAWVSLTALASAAPAEPLVTITPYSRTVSGTIGTATAGVTVHLLLKRSYGADTVDTATATTNGAGAWTATFPVHAPLPGYGDEVAVSYSGTGAPAASSYAAGVGGSGVLNPSGTTLTISCSWYSESETGCGSSIPVSVHYGTGATASVAATPGFPGSTEYQATLSPSVTANDAVTFTPTLPYDSWNGSEVVPSQLAVVLTAGLPGVEASYEEGEEYAPGPTPHCAVDLTASRIVCQKLQGGGSYTLEQLRAGTPVASQPVTAVAPHSGAPGIAEATFAGLQTGDELALIAPAAGGTAARTLTTLHLLPLSLAITEPDAHLGEGEGAGICQPGELELETSQVCHPDGTFSPLEWYGGPYGIPSRFVDDLSGGVVKVSVPTFHDESPIDNETVAPSFTAYADTTNYGHFDATATVSLSLRPLAGGATLTPAGNANASAGVAVTGLPGGRYAATWTLTDPHGDSNRLTTFLVVDPALGAPGPAGSPGPPGPRGEPGKAAEVKCQTTGKGRHKKTTCKVIQLASASSVRARLSRGRIVYALGHARARGHRAALRLHALRAIPPGRYVLTLVLERGRRSLTISRRVRL